MTWFRSIWKRIFKRKVTDHDRCRMLESYLNAAHPSRKHEVTLRSDRIGDWDVTPPLEEGTKD